MSFNPVIKKEVSQNENQTTASNPSNQQIVVYNGRNVVYPPSYSEEQQLKSMNMTWADKVLMGMGDIMSVDIGILPPNLVAMTRKMLSMIDERPPSAVVSTSFGKFERSIDEQIVAEEQHQASQKKLIEMFNDRFDQMKMERQQQLQLAGVRSPEELAKKEMLIASYKANAEEQYLHDPANLERRKEIDKTLVTAYKGTLNAKDQKVIEDYWTLISRGGEGTKKARSIESRQSKLFLDAMMNSNMKMMEQVEEAVKEGKGISQSEILTANFQRTLNETSQKVANERKACTNSDEAVILDYNILTGSYQMPSIVNALLRIALKQQVQQARERLASSVEFCKKRNQDVIEWNNDFIKQWEERIQQDQHKMKNPDLERMQEYYMKSSERHKENIADLRKDNMKWQSLTEKDFEKEACKLFKLTHPDEIEAKIPEETAFDILYQQYMELEGADLSKAITTPSLFPVSNDMRLDIVSTGSPEEHFFNTIKQLDIQKLALLKPTGIEEVV